MPRRTRTVLSLVAVLVAAIACVAPFGPVLGHWPMGNDAFVWTVRPHPETEGWASWVFLHRHFIGYRPVTALTFSLDGALAGWQPWAWAATDLVLHALAGVGVWAAWRALARERAPEWGVLAAVLFWCHPVSQAVAPFVARRSYSLATVLSLFAVALFASAIVGPDRGGSPPLPRRTVGIPAAGVLLLALLANETAYVLVPVLGLFALVGGIDRRSAAPSVLPVLLAAGAAFTLRLLILGEVGGYDDAWSAEVTDGVRVLVADGSVPSILARAVSFSVFPASPSGEPSFVLASAGAPAAVAVVLWMIATSSWEAVRGRPLALVLLMWAAGYAALAAATLSWFPRLAYPMVAALSLWSVDRLSVAVEDLRARRPAALHLAPLAVLVAMIAQQATPLRGLDPEPIRGTIRASELVDRSLAALAAVEAPALVWVALPVRGGNVATTLHWIEREAGERGIEVRLLANAVQGERTEPARTFGERRGADGREGIRPAEDMQWTEEARDEFALGAARAALDPSRLVVDDRPTWLLAVVDGAPVLRPLR